MNTYQDQIGRILEFKKTPKRIISLVPSLTELLVDLGLENSIVGWMVRVLDILSVQGRVFTLCFEF